MTNSLALLHRGPPARRKGSARRNPDGRILALLLALAPLPALAQSVSADAQRLAQAIERAGCVVTARNGDQLVERTGLTEAEVYATVAELYQAGLLRMQDNGTGRLFTPACE